MRQWFSILHGVRQGGVLSQYLYAIYVDDLINELRTSGYGVHIGSVFVGCLLCRRYSSVVAILLWASKAP